jgi:hypothetical protein
MGTLTVGTGLGLGGGVVAQADKASNEAGSNIRIKNHPDG